MGSLGFHPTRKWHVEEQDGPFEITDMEIIQTYYVWWARGMCQIGKWDLVSPEGCIEDFVIVHWASQVQ